MAKVILSGYILVAISELATVKDALLQHTELTKQELGCLIFEVTQDSQDSCRFNVYEEFVDHASFAAHQSRVANSTWGEVTVNVERHYQISPQ
ncbi:antibiotic biosynthesis monooxygenase [Shewanella sp. Choline-02u-19]|uniref:putative quinol monooxygenase n=1 Tax=unclassified Shewanella TaxID=196818 RepID=UPI000C33936F|nr:MULTISPECIES: antibiotic biosynthesis monooxygenase [unclassified Shewanella]PKH55402.1 antibiotic biosynthesis monooxygenase [Shewanella sp. Bg11-22]PKI28749.1 antibiotic biosynthesis monooxygenase [Shewanella sp. Choline-02u-19]